MISLGNLESESLERMMKLSKVWKRCSVAAILEREKAVPWIEEWIEFLNESTVFQRSSKSLGWLYFLHLVKSSLRLHLTEPLAKPCIKQGPEYLSKYVHMHLLGNAFVRKWSELNELQPPFCICSGHKSYGQHLLVFLRYSGQKKCYCPWETNWLMTMLFVTITSVSLTFTTHC